MSATHSPPADGAECASCMEDLSAENYVEYQQVEGECRVALWGLW